MVCHITVSRELPVEEENIQTQLHKRSSEEHYTYTNVPWKIYLRKEASVICFGLGQWDIAPLQESMEMIMKH